MKLGPWVRAFPSEFVSADSRALVRYPEPLDGRLWDLDGTPRWVAMVSVCCGGATGRPEHFDWTVDRSPSTETERDIQGNTVRTSFEAAQQEADQYMRSLEWDLT